MFLFQSFWTRFWTLRIAEHDNILRDTEQEDKRVWALRDVELRPLPALNS